MTLLFVFYIAAQEYAESHGAVYVETSAKTAINVAALFVEISKYLFLYNKNMHENKNELRRGED